MELASTLMKPKWFSGWMDHYCGLSSPVMEIPVPLSNFQLLSVLTWRLRPWCVFRNDIPRWKQNKEGREKSRFGLVYKIPSRKLSGVTMEDSRKWLACAGFQWPLEFSLTFDSPAHESPNYSGRVTSHLHRKCTRNLLINQTCA